MINTNGYYLESPRFYKDNIGGNEIKGFSHNAYKFNEDGSFITKTKYNDHLSINFLKSDFDDLVNNKYFLEKNIIKLIFNSDKDYSHVHEVEIFDINTLCDKERVLKFISF